MRLVGRIRRAGRPNRRDDFASWPAVKPGRLTLPARTSDITRMAGGEDVPLLSIVPVRPAADHREHS